MASENKRFGFKLTSRKLAENLNEKQSLALKELELKGWELRFIRQFADEDSIIIVSDGDGGNYLVMNNDGICEKMDIKGYRL